MKHISKQSSLFEHDNKRKIVSTVEQDEFTAAASEAFDFAFTGQTEFMSYGKPNVPKEFALGLIVGASGSGKSTLLKEFGKEAEPQWNFKKAIVSHFETPEQAIEKLGAVGLNNIPSWCRPYHCLSTGEKFRADLARKINNNNVIDEFTSVVDRNVAIASSVALRRYIDKKQIKGMVLASCHRDIIEWLNPDWVFDTDTGELSVGRFLRRPKISIQIYAAKNGCWEMFKKHHYLTNDLSQSARCFIAVWNEIVVGFSASLPLPSGTVQNAWREHRTVLLPDYQGLGIGVRISDAIATIHLEEGKRYYSKTSHPRMGAYRNQSKLWRKTLSSNKPAAKNTNEAFNKTLRFGKNCWSHEFVGIERKNITKQITEEAIFNF